MKDYSNGKIYAIRSAQTDDIYIGSTIQTLCVRMAGHRLNYKNYISDKKHCVTSFKLLQFGDAYIELLEAYPCACKEELTKREGELMRENKNCINKCVAGRTVKQYYEENEEKSQQYYQENKDKISAYMQQYRQDNKDKISACKKKYYENNKDKLSACRKNYYENNKDKPLANQK